MLDEGGSWWLSFRGWGSGGEASTRWGISQLEGLFRRRLWADDRELTGKQEDVPPHLLPTPSTILPLPFSLTLSLHLLEVLTALPLISIPVFLFPLPWFSSFAIVPQGVWTSSLPLPSITCTAPETSPSPAQTLLFSDVAHTALQDLSSFHFPTPHLHPACPVLYLHRDLLNLHPYSFLFSVPQRLSQLPCPLCYFYSPLRFWSVWYLPSPVSDLGAPFLCFPTLTASFW